MVTATRILCLLLLLYQGYIVVMTIKDTSPEGRNITGLQICCFFTVFFAMCADGFAQRIQPVTGLADWMYSFSITCYIIMLFFLLRYTLDLAGVDDARKRNLSYVMAFITAVDGAAMITNPVTAWMFRGTYELMGTQARVYLPAQGIPFIIHSVYCSVVSVACAILLLADAVRSSFRYKSRNVYMILIIFGCGFMMSMSLFYPILYEKAFLLPIGLSLSGILVYIFVYMYRPRCSLVMLRVLIFRNFPDPVILFSTCGILVDFNKAAADIFGLSRRADRQLTIDEFLRTKLGGQIRQRSSETVEEVDVSSASGKRTFKLGYVPLGRKHSGVSEGTLLHFSDITEFRQMYDTMKQAAMTDRLTGFASQMMLDRKLSEINLYRKYPYTAAVCTISGLQFISDGFGESAHDMAVIRLSEAIRKRIRAEDFAAAGGDTIVLLLPEAGAGDADRILEQVNSILREERVLPFPLSAEYGSASRPDPDAPMQETVERARSIMIRRKMLHISEVNEQLVKALRKTLAETGRETAAHTANIKILCEKLGKSLRLDSTQMKNLVLLAEFHDIGKQPISSDILAKGNSLTGKELELKKLHAVNGSCLAHSVPELETIADDILCHHERWDGTGYPNGFAGERIPYLARILSVADAFDAMTHDRSGYRAVSEQDALDELKKCSGTQFDPKIVKAFISLFGN